MFGMSSGVFAAFHMMSLPMSHLNLLTILLTIL